ncbi:S8 family serine peptidase [Micromonospora olivasterospora]|uniref:Type VII secretion-associated serine protease mycosin n=1 Tax=Micromonospora olivasterospora TaxID=1880 RepID=A0A562IBK0_MICOL|nr:S8 family serine peptidase [Micromonospora olivasterospora]TWH68075.1 type VII secretion-associated serine protease mycosin [Micromonospora olivasterospora]
MRTGKHRRPLLRSVTAVLALVAVVGSGPLAAPEPARAADTVRGLQWYLDALRIPEAHKLTKGRGVTVAVVDGGVHAAHPDLKGQVLPGRAFSPDVARDGRTDPDSESGHGTAMAGIIAGRGGGAMRELGIAPEAKILPVALGPEGPGRDLPSALRYAADAGADVINLSVGAPGSDPKITEAVRYALDKGAVVVASAGNRRVDRAVPLPANIPGVLAVGATGKGGSLWSGSVTGPEVGLTAPGERIIAPVPPPVSPNGYGVSDGTSQATAIVSGVAALVRARHPKLNAANVVNRLIRTAEDRGARGRDPEYGFGAVDVLAALTRSVPAVDGNPLLAAASPSPKPATGDDGDDGPAVSFGLADNAGLQLGLCLLAVLLVGVVAVVLIVVNRRAARRRAAAPPVGGPPPPPGVPHPGYGPPPAQRPGPHPYQPRPVAQPAPPHAYGPPGQHGAQPYGGQHGAQPYGGQHGAQPYGGRQGAPPYGPPGWQGGPPHGPAGPPPGVAGAPPPPGSTPGGHAAGAPPVDPEPR